MLMCKYADVQMMFQISNVQISDVQMMFNYMLLESIQKSSAHLHI